MNKGGKLCGEPLPTPTRDEHDEERERSERCPVLKGGAEADAAIIEQREQPGKPKPDDEVRK